MPAPASLHNVTGLRAEAAAFNAAIASARSVMTMQAALSGFPGGPLAARPVRLAAARPVRLAAARRAAALFIQTSSSSQLAHGDGSVSHAVGEAPLVVVPGEHAHEALIDHLGLLEIEG